MASGYHIISAEIDIFVNAASLLVSTGLEDAEDVFYVFQFYLCPSM